MRSQFCRALTYSRRPQRSWHNLVRSIVEPPTTGALGVEWRIQGDDNRNAAVALAWRRTGETAWRDGLPLLRLQGEAVQQGASFHYVAPNMFAGSVFGLDPDTSYDIRLRLSDPDAPRKASRSNEW